MPETKELTNVEIAARNDKIRKLLPFSHKDDRIVMTRGINSMGPIIVAEAIGAVQKQDKFEEGDDPYGEHDFGVFELTTGDKCFWKIDDYNGHDGIRCVLTVMLASEY